MRMCVCGVGLFEFVRPAVVHLQRVGISHLGLQHSIFFIASGVGLSPLHCGHFWPIVLAPDDR
jgi:hypothetical protein